MIHQNLATEFNRQACALLDQSLVKLEHCLEQLTREQIWWRPSTGMNSIGNLLLHIDGNLRQWAITGLTSQSDRRDRNAEFAATDYGSAEELLDRIRKTVAECQQIVVRISAERLLEQVEIQGFSVSVLQAVLHTTSHFQGHTHQVIQLSRWQLKQDYKFEWSPQQSRGILPM